MSNKAFLGSQKLGEILSDLAPLQCLDIGARGKLIDDLLPMSWAIIFYGFEPDKQECENLNNYYSVDYNNTYKKTKFFPLALGQKKEKRTLHFTKHRGSSTLLLPIAEVGESFSRSEYTTVEETCKIETVPLDDFLESNAIDNVVYLKVDIEGLELEVLKSSTHLLSSSLLALRVEVAFIRSRIGQPYYIDIEKFLRNYDFIPMGFPVLTHWRRLTKVKYPKSNNGIIPFSKGQIAHGDVLFFKDPDVFIERPPEEAMKAAFLSMSYGYVDHAYYILNQSSSKKYLKNKYSISFEKELKTVSLMLQRQYKMRKLHSYFSKLKSSASRIMGSKNKSRFLRLYAHLFTTRRNT